MDNQDVVIIPSPQNNNKEQINLEYVEIIEAVNNCKTARLLKNLLSGRFGELTLLNTFLFQTFILSNNNINLKKELYQIINKSTIHINLIGRAVYLFGTIPRYTNGQCVFWSGRYVNYETNVNNILLNNINLIEKNINLIEQSIIKISNNSLKKLLNQIISDKKKQIEVFRSFLNM